MATQNIPLLNIPRQRLTTSLGNQQVTLIVWYQPSDESWYASLEFPVGTPLVSGRRVVLDSGIVEGYPAGTFDGDVICRAIGDVTAQPGVKPWGLTHNLRFEQ